MVTGPLLYPSHSSDSPGQMLCYMSPCLWVNHSMTPNGTVAEALQAGKANSYLEYSFLWE